MRFVQVESIPKQINDAPRKRVYELLENFLKSDMDYALVVFDPGEYTRLESARQTFIRTCRHFGYGIDVKVRNGEIYLVRRGANL